MAVDELVIKWSMDSQEFDKGITSMNRSMNLLKSEFGATSNKLKQFGSETDQLKNKQEYLNKAMEIQKAKIDTLKKSYDNQVKATGENSKEAENLAIKLNNQIKYYNNLENELDKTNAELELQSNKWNKVSKNLESVGSKVKDLGGKISSIGGSFSTKITAPLTAAFALLTKGTQELRMDMSKLEANVNSAGLSIEETSKQFTYLSAITGETDSSIEALSNLLNSGLTQTQMQQAVDNLSGAIVKFPDTLKIESLADSLQETLATGEATGQYGELLERLGVNLDDFNLGLQEATVNGTAQQYALDILAKNGLANLNEEYQKNNEQMIKNAQSQEELKNKVAELGEKLTPILTTITELTSKVVGTFNNLDSETQKNIITIGLFLAAVGPVISVIGGIVSIVGTAITVFSTISGAIAVVTTGAAAATPAIGALATAFTILTGPIGLVIAAITAVIAIGVLLWQNWDVIKEKATQLGNWLGEKWQGIKDKTSESWNSIKDKTSQVWGNIKSKIEENGGGIKGIIGTYCEVYKTGWSTAFNAMDSATGGALGRMKTTVSNGLGSIKNFFSNLSLPEIKLPHIKLPHFSLSGSFSLKPPSVPKLNVDWYHTGAIFTKPTILGGIGVGDAYKGTGSNAEAVIPLDSMYQNVRNIVREEQTTQPIYVVVNVANNMDNKAIGKAVTSEVKKEITRGTTNYRKGKGGLTFG
ncbi:hypothetical protein H9660_05345 [Clostridium sp. Sa3CUN1]|uniref:Phage tail tape measure protein n=1 Tax=Clostridium gallinarum TaxID=2762246 RepID=A0ABR8Q2B8_9CLOT|nr:hypothetical protein [Clostridium gallinarum]MBD7914563.1 hypothetical protein [Clostridium gallinarum]